MLLTLWRLTSQDEAVLLVPGFHFHSTLTSWLSHKKRCCVAKVAIAFFSPSILSMKRNEASLISHFISAHVRETVLQVIADPSGCDASSDKEFAQKSVYEVDDEDEPAGEQLEAVDDDPLRRPHPAAVEGEIPEEIEIEGEKHSAKSSLRKLREGLRVCGLQKHRSKDQAWKRIPNTMGILLRILVLHSPGGNSRGESCLKALHWDYHTMVNQASSEVNIKDARQTKAKMTFKQEMRTLASICAVMDDADAITASVTATKGDVPWGTYSTITTMWLRPQRLQQMQHRAQQHQLLELLRLQQQVLALEESCEEARKARMALAEELRCAVLLKCISGQLKTHLNLQLADNSRYSDVREQILKWDRAQARWSQWLSGPEVSESQPMEIDRIEGKGNKGRGKGKGKQGATGQKGKSKGKMKDTSKGKNASYDKGGKSGEGKSMQNQNNKGGKGDKSCYICGKTGHYARDCWNNSVVRSVQGTPQGHVDQGQSSNQQVGQQQQTQQAPVQSPQSQSTQFRVARISELNVDAIDDHEQFVCDLRVSPSVSPTSSSGAVKAVHFYIGDDDDEPCSTCTCSVRAIATELPDQDMRCILLDSGQMLLYSHQNLLVQVMNLQVVLQNCMMLKALEFQYQGTCRASEPLYAWWSGAGSGLLVMLQPVVQQQPVASVCAVKADVTPELRLGPAGWTFDENNCGVGLVDLSAEFYGYDGARDTITIISQGEVDPVLLGFKLLGDEEPLFPDVERHEHARDGVLVSVEDDMQGVDIGGEHDLHGADVPLQGRLVVSASPQDMVRVNGVELTPDSALRALRTSGTEHVRFKDQMF
eukprot:s881_g13.t2